MATVESYSFGKITVDGKQYMGDLIIFPDRVQDNWWRKTGHEVCLADIGSIIDAAPGVVVFGTGAMGLVNVLPEVVDALAAAGWHVVVEPTDRACDEYSRLREKGNRVVLALHLTC